MARVTAKLTCKAVSIISEGLPRQKNDDQLAYRLYHEAN